MVTRTTCPRCGYDLRGALASWDESCPLTGTCTECGLRLRWAEVLCPQKFEPQWCVEFVRGRRGVAGALWRTVGWSFRPFSFWSAVKMSMALRPRRLALYAAALLSMMVVAGAVTQATAAIRLRYQAEKLYTVKLSYGAAIAEAMFTPWGWTSSGTIGTSRGVGPYVAPRDIHVTLLQKISSRETRRLTHRRQVMATATAAGLALWVWLGVPLSFVLLPISRRRARVRWGHLVRVAVYGLVVPVLVVTAVVLCLGVGYAVEPWRDNMIVTVHTLCRYAPVPLLVVWWAAATGGYLGIPNHWPVALLLSVMVTLLYLAGLWLAAPDFLIYLS